MNKLMIHGVKTTILGNRRGGKDSFPVILKNINLTVYSKNYFIQIFAIPPNASNI